MLIQQLASLKADLMHRVSSSIDRMDDYEIEIEINYYLRDDDPDFNEEADNIIAVRSGKHRYDILKDLDWSV